MLHIKYGHYHIQVSHGCLATRQLWENGLVVKSIHASAEIFHDCQFTFILHLKKLKLVSPFHVC